MTQCFNDEGDFPSVDNAVVRWLMYAYDRVILCKSRKWTKSALNDLNTYCKMWTLIG